MTAAGRDEDRFWNAAVQTAPRDELRGLQLERVQRQIKRAHEVPVPLFKRKLEAAGVGPAGVTSLDELDSIPLTVKQELRDAEAAHPPFGDYRGAPLADCVRLATTTGTSGRPTILLWTKRDLEIEYEAYCRNQRRGGLKPGDTVVVTAHPGYLNGGEPMVRGAMEHFGALCVSVGPPTDEAEIRKAIEIFQLVKPTRYALMGPARLKFYEVAKEMGLDPEEDLGLTPAPVNPAAQYLSASAGMDAFAYLGSACSAERGAHVAEDLAIVQIVDPATGRSLPDGERGHLVLTTLERDNFVVRYDLEDIAHLETDPCACGETTARLFWHGRDKDVVRVADKTLLPIDVELPLQAFDELKQPALIFQLARRASQPQAQLEIRVEAEGDIDRDKISVSLAQSVGVPAVIEWLPLGGIPRTTYKPAYIVDIED